MSRYFGTDGIRDADLGPLLTASFLRRLGWAAGQWRGEESPGRRALIGMDTRASGPRLAGDLAAGLKAAGWEVETAGIVPTPAISVALQAGLATLGLMVTASHNPAGDNGVKIFTADGRKLTVAEEDRVEGLLDRAGDFSMAGTSRLETDGGACLQRYVERARAALPPGSLAGWRLVLDTAHGATCLVSREVLEEAGAQLTVIGGDPDGANINHQCGSEHPARLAGEVTRRKAHLGIAHDGDGDRVLFVDESGAVADGDQIMGLLAGRMARQGLLPKRTVVATLISNAGLDRYLDKLGLHLERVAVGDRWVSERLREGGHPFGGESSGHFIFTESSPTGDGLMAAIHLLRLLRESERGLAEWRREAPLFPQCLRNLRVARRRPFEELEGLSETAREWEERLAGRGRLLIRYSGTEAKLRLLVEAEVAELAEDCLRHLEAAARRELEVLA